MTNEKNKVEALLFAVAKRINLEDISKITGIRDDDKIKAALLELQADYENKGGSMVLHDEGDGFWKMTVKDHYNSIVEKVVSQTELDRPLMETLAVIAWKYPVLQADVIKIRHNKAYDHLKQLEVLGFVTRQRFGRTNKLTLTQKFFEYFDLPSKEQAKEVFRDIIPEKIKDKVLKTEEEIEVAERKIEEARLRKEEMKKESKASSEEGLKEELEQLQKEEDGKLEQVDKDLKDLEKEENKDAYSQVSPVQKSDEVSESDKRPEGQE